LLADARFDSRSFSEGWCPGATTITNLFWEQEQKLRSVATKSRLGGAKTVTNNLPILSVLAHVIILKFSWFATVSEELFYLFCEIINTCIPFCNIYLRILVVYLFN
jgi:hypothetical protein